MDIEPGIADGNQSLMRIVLLEAFFTGSHQKWALGLQLHSRHQIEIISLPGRFWKWRMHGAAISLANRVNQLKYTPDLLLTTDMMDSALFKSLLKPTFGNIPLAVYFHENQITYPWSSTDRDIQHGRDRHYGFINYTSALVADRAFFNSTYHREAFLQALPKFLKAFPDHRNMETIEQIRRKSKVLYLGLELSAMDSVLPENTENQDPVILWNHRWEYDKNPELFFETLYALADAQVPFKLVVLGENTSHRPTIFDEARQKLADRILHWGYVDSYEEYVRLLETADCLPVTSNQDYFGISVVEAVYAGCMPLLPQRLTYPELFPKEQFLDLFYQDQDELLTKLKSYLSSHPKKRLSDTLKVHLQKFDWKDQIRQYDEELQSCSEDHKS